MISPACRRRRPPPSGRPRASTGKRLFADPVGLVIARERIQKELPADSNVRARAALQPAATIACWNSVRI